MLEALGIDVELSPEQVRARPIAALVRWVAVLASGGPQGQSMCLSIVVPVLQVATCVETTGVGFMFAPVVHPAMKVRNCVRRHVTLSQRHEADFRRIVNEM